MMCRASIWYNAKMRIGEKLRLEVYGESHAPCIGMRLEGFPAGVRLDFAALQAFMERRAPGRDPLSTSRREPDVPEFVGGVEGDTTTGGAIEAVIRNTDTRSGDYEKTVPRPGHADYPNWVKTGAIPPGGGANSGRLTAAMCIAGGICLQELARRGVKIESRVETCDIESAKADGDSVGGIVECAVSGLPPGLGGAMFDGIDGAIAQAIFGIPGVKGIEFGNGFACAGLRGSENNDEFEVEDGRVVTSTNRHGGVLGGMTSGMPVVFRVAMKPTPSIYKPQKSVDLATMIPVTLQVKGRHDPCIARRAAPVVEALAAFVVLDAILVEEGDIEFRPVGDGEGLPNIVIDANVAKIYQKLAAKAIFVVPSGEEGKTIETVERIWSAFAKAGVGRKDCVTAIGGGVTGDLTGFAAATWMRGIDWINVPTTLLAMVDASYGGKTACDIAEGKNLAGAFHSPRRVIIDTAFLETLPERERRCGRAEMIKHDIIAGRTLSGIRENVGVKVGIVRRDPLEKTGERIKLNCGHTVAHAIEKMSDYAVSHGEAVSIGCVEEARFAERLGLAEVGWSDEVKAMFAKEGLPTELPDGVTFESLVPLMKGDKKRHGECVTFALPCAMGRVVAKTVDFSKGVADA